MTPEALAFLARGLVPTSVAGTCYRLRRGPDGGVAGAVAAPDPDDVVVRHEGRVVLAIEGVLAAELDGRTIDLESGPDGGGSLIVL